MCGAGVSSSAFIFLVQIFLCFTLSINTVTFSRRKFLILGKFCPIIYNFYTFNHFIPQTTEPISWECKLRICFQPFRIKSSFSSQTKIQGASLLQFPPSCQTWSAEALAACATAGSCCDSHSLLENLIISRSFLR